MKILIVHHVEPMWEEWFNSYELIPKILKHARRVQYDRIVLTQMEEERYPLYGEFNSLNNLIVKQWDYCVGRGTYDETIEYYQYENCQEMLSDYYREDIIENIIPVSSHHKVAYVYPWIRQLRGDGNNKIFTCGGHKNACLLTFHDTLRHLNIPFKPLDNLIYGD